MATRTEYQRTYMRKRRLKLREKGLCIVCSTRQPKPGYTTCSVCIAKATERNSK